MNDRSDTLKRFLSYIGNHKFLFLLVAILVSSSAICNLLGTYMIRPIVNLAIDNDFSVVLGQIIIMAIIYLIGVLSTFGYTQLMAIGAQKIVKEIRHDLFAVVQKLPIVKFDTTTHGEFMSRFTNDVDTVSDALNNSFAMMIQNFIQLVGTITMLLILNWRLTLIVFVFYVLMFIYIKYSGTKSKAYFRLQQQELGKLNGFVEESMAGQKVVKIFNHESKQQESFDKINARLQMSSQKALGYSHTMVPMVVSMSYVNYAIVAVIGGFMTIKGMVDIGSLASYLVFVRQAASPINQFVGQSNLVLVGLAGAQRIFDLMDQEPEVDEGKVRLVKIDDKWMWQLADGKTIELKGNICFNHVDFGYDHDLVLKDINFEARPGQKIAFVGATGAGKTTITNLLNRFYDIKSGTITYDGIDIKQIKKADLRHSMSMVLQDTHLFSGTIMDNIRYGRLEADDEACINASKIANAYSFIRRLPNGFETMVNNDGANLSQGQRQLLAIARAAVADPRVLILDEATSSIDTRTESLIENGMDKLMEGRTVLVIAHRLSTVRNADVIIVLDHGKIIEMGNHEQLINEHGMYDKLYRGMFELS